ncbi:uncharacterized protein METZ01_LOCUS399220 [marine metagenome]|uniref:Uncharacterized protein n=1 Tax=marine metagenome TaxID=408172 RepID=A0A382VIL5_9ZZZZ
MEVVLVNRFTVRTQARRLFIRHRSPFSFFCAGLQVSPGTGGTETRGRTQKLASGMDRTRRYLPTTCPPEPRLSGAEKRNTFVAINPNQIPPSHLRAEMRG